MEMAVGAPLGHTISFSNVYIPDDVIGVGHVVMLYAYAKKEEEEEGEVMIKMTVRKAVRRDNVGGCVVVVFIM